MKKIVILTGSELRHRFMRIALSNHPQIQVLRSYCEDQSQSLVNRLNKSNEQTSAQIHHAEARTRAEQDFFKFACDLAEDKSNSVTIEKGTINAPPVVEAIKDLKPDLLCCYGSSIIKSDLIDLFKNRFLNLHLGLSPYYRGSGTNYFPLVNREPQYVGATFMHLNRGIDTGQIIHQIQARIFRGDSIHQIGNRLICDASLVYAELISKFEEIALLEQPIASKPKLYLRKHFTSASLEALEHNFRSGMIEEYLGATSEKLQNVILCRQNFLAETN